MSSTTSGQDGVHVLPAIRAWPDRPFVPTTKLVFSNLVSASSSRLSERRCARHGPPSARRSVHFRPPPRNGRYAAPTVAEPLEGRRSAKAHLLRPWRGQARTGRSRPCRPQTV